MATPSRSKPSPRRRLPCSTCWPDIRPASSRCCAKARTARARTGRRTSTSGPASPSSTANCRVVGRGPRLHLLRRRMAKPQSGALAARPLPRLRWKRTRPRQASAVRHLKERPCLAAFALLAGVARRAQSRGDRRTGGRGNRPTEDTSMTGKKTAKETKPSTVVANDPDDLKGTQKSAGEN